MAEGDAFDNFKPQCVTLARATAQTTNVGRTTMFMGVLSCMGRLSLNSVPNTPIENLTMHSPLPATARTSTLRHTLQRGFTLIELMVVLVIIGVLAALIVPNVLDRADDARSTAARTDVANLTQALKLYKLDNMRYPTAEQGLQALIAKPTAAPAPSNWKPYLDKLPNDPWGRPYQYLNPGVKGEIDVMSFGADGQAGGDGKNADIGSWQ
jgi:general secretion pathway protein G